MLADQCPEQDMCSPFSHVHAAPATVMAFEKGLGLHLSPDGGYLLVLDGLGWTAGSGETTLRGQERMAASRFG